MSCDYCANSDGTSCFPSYGPAPHSCFYKLTGAEIGESQALPRDEWPDNFQEDADCAGLGTYWCPHCWHGRPPLTP